MSMKSNRYGKTIALPAVLIGCLIVVIGQARAVELPVTDNLLTRFRADAGVTESGGYVTAWADQATVVGGANDAVQANSAMQPQLITVGSPMGDLPVVRFDGGDYLDIAANTAFESSTFSMFAVYTAAALETGTQRVFEVADAVTGTSAGFLGISVYLSTGDSRPHAVYGRDVDSYKPLVSSPVPVTDIAMISGVLNGSPEEVNGIGNNEFYGWLNGTAIDPRYGMDVTPTGNLGAGIGARAIYANSNFLTGDIAEILVYDTALSDIDRLAVEEYLDIKWFWPVVIPGDTNGDGIVNDTDAATLAANWQKQGDALWSEGDFNGDRAVDDIDATILASNWQAGAGANTTVPEPSTLAALLALLSVGVIGFRRR